ncbi:MAG: MFS transporter, partial [Pseudomonas sp.]|nr:MFS transporter [Pseudomonas sp.]
MSLDKHPARVFANWALLVVLGLNLRPLLSSISPLLLEIRHDTGMSFQSSAWLTSLPVICMGLVALLGVRLQAGLGERRGVALGLSMILGACLWRLSADQAETLMATALLGGAGVALIQVLVPALIKRQFAQRVAL